MVVAGMILQERWYVEAEKWPDETPPQVIERKDPTPTWRDPDRWLPEQVDQVQAQALALMKAAGPPLNLILHNMDKVPHRSFLKAEYIRQELDELSWHLDHYLHMQTMWRGKDYTAMLDEIEDIAQHVRQIYLDALPYLRGEKELPAPSPSTQLLEDLGIEDGQLSLPEAVQDVEFE